MDKAGSEGLERWKNSSTAVVLFGFFPASGKEDEQTVDLSNMRMYEIGDK